MIRAVAAPGAFQDRNNFMGKGFLGGVAMAAPFYAEFLPWRWAVLLAAPFFLFFLIYREKIKRPQLVILPFILLLVLHGVALVFSTTPFAEQVVKDLIVATFLLLVFVLADEDISEGFFLALIPLASLAALLGLLKAALLDRGFLIGFIADGCSYYPAGSALCVNYNNLGFVWLVAVLGCMRTRFWWVIPILVAAGALSSSRRFIVLVMFVPFLWMVLQGRPALAKILFCVLLSMLLIGVVSDPENFEKFRFGEVPYTVLNFSDAYTASDWLVNRSAPDVMLGAMADGTSDWLINRSAPDVMLGTMADGTLGTASRLEFWALGVSMLGWAPQGWRYHEVFSCRFSDCTSFHYPHMAIISEWIIGGVVFALVAIAFFLWPFWKILSARKFFPVALFLLVMPYVLISGDTVFSLPICISCMLVALTTAERSVPRLVSPV